MILSVETDPCAAFLVTMCAMIMTVVFVAIHDMRAICRIDLDRRPSRRRPRSDILIWPLNAGDAVVMFVTHKPRGRAAGPCNMKIVI